MCSTFSFLGFFFLVLWVVGLFGFFLLILVEGRFWFYPTNFNPEFPFFVQSISGGAEN